MTQLRASKIMAERAFANDKIPFAWNSKVAEIHGDDKLSGVTLRDTRTGEARELRGDRPVRRDRARPAQRAGQGRRRARRRPATSSASRARTSLTNVDGRLRLRRPRRPHLPPGRHRCRVRLRRGPRRRALPAASTPGTSRDTPTRRRCRRPARSRRAADEATPTARSAVLTSPRACRPGTAHR